MADLNFTNDELSEMECLQIRGGAGAGGDGIMAQGECTNGVAGCGGNIDQGKCTNMAAGCGEAQMSCQVPSQPVHVYCK